MNYKAKLYVVGAHEHDDVQCWLDDVHVHNSVLEVMKKEDMEVGEKLEITHARMQEIACNYLCRECPKDWQLVEWARATAKRADFIYALVAAPQ